MTEKSNGTKTEHAGPTKMQQVEKAMAKLGNDAPPLKIQAYVKQYYRLEMTTDHISAYKSEIRKRQAANPGVPAAKAPVAKKPVVAATPVKKPVMTATPAKPKVAPAPKAAPAAKAAPTPKIAPAPKVAPAPKMQSVAQAPPKANEVVIPDLQTVKELLSRNSVKNLKTLIDLLAE